MGVRTNVELFIIESLALEDEEDGLQEGRIISDMLHLAGKKKTRYYYIRTRRELEKIIEIFGESKHRYLHISCHAGKSRFYTTFDTVSYARLSKMLRPHLQGRRVFVSACQMANETLAEELFRDSEVLSLVGPKEDVYIDDAAAFWVSLYHLMFKKNVKRMTGKDLRETIEQLSTMYDEHINYFGALKGSSRFSLHSVSP